MAAPEVPLMAASPTRGSDHMGSGRRKALTPPPTDRTPTAAPNVARPGPRKRSQHDSWSPTDSSKKPRLPSQHELPLKVPPPPDRGGAWSAVNSPPVTPQSQRTGWEEFEASRPLYRPLAAGRTPDERRETWRGAEQGRPRSPAARTPRSAADIDKPPAAAPPPPLPTPDADHVEPRAIVESATGGSPPAPHAPLPSQGRPGGPRDGEQERRSAPRPEHATAPGPPSPQSATSRETVGTPPATTTAAAPPVGPPTPVSSPTDESPPDGTGRVLAVCDWSWAALDLTACGSAPATFAAIARQFPRFSEVTAEAIEGVQTTVCHREGGPDRARREAFVCRDSDAEAVGKLVRRLEWYKNLRAGPRAETFELEAVVFYWRDESRMV